MSDKSTRKSSLVNLLAEAFSSYVERHTLHSAMILEKMLFFAPDEFPGNPEEQTEKIQRVVCLLMLLPQKTASEILAAFRCFENEEEIEFFDRFIFEMARIDDFDTSDFTGALGEFTSLDSEEPFGGIDKTRFITESAFGTQRMIDSINRLTAVLTESIEKKDDDPGTH